MPAPTSSTHPDLSNTSRRRALAPGSDLRLVRNDEPSREDLERELLAFDPDDDLAAIIVMPPSIPTDVRDAIVRVVAARFEYDDDLENWLHAPQAALAGATPYECLVYGDGRAVLRALGEAEEDPGVAGRESSAPAA